MRTSEGRLLTTKGTVLGVQTIKRNKNIPAVQTILTEYGRIIRILLGLQDCIKSVSSTMYLLLLNTCGEATLLLEQAAKFKETLVIAVEEKLFDA